MTLLNQDVLARTLDARFADDLLSERVSGAAACVMQNGACVYRRFVGTEVPNADVPVNEKSIFRLASMTKPVTAVAVLLLAEQGRLHLDDPIEKFLPEFRDRRLWAIGADGNVTDLGAVATKPTVLHLLTHTSGLCSGALGEYASANMPREARRNLASATTYYATQGLGFEPFTKQEYSPVAAYDVLARIVEVVSGERFGAFLKRFIFDRCEMGDTTFSPIGDQWSRLVTMQDYRDGHAIAVPGIEGCVFEDYPTTYEMGGAGLVSTLDDYVHFSEMLREGGAYRGCRVLGEKWTSLMTSPVVPPSVQAGYKRWGLSVRVIVGAGYRLLPVGAYGWGGVFGTYFWVDPVNRITAVYMRNSYYDGGFVSRISHHFEEDVHRALE